jgi:molybdate transport system substrate-binding protein
MQMLHLKQIKHSLSVLLITFTVFSCSRSSNNEKVRLFVAASLAESVDSLTKLFSKNNNIEFEINAASSGTLAKQIEQGAPSAIYFSANIKWMDYLVGQGLLTDTCFKVFAKNELVLVSSNSNQLESAKLADLPQLLLGNKKIALGKPEHVPAGKYAKEVLTKLNIFDFLQQSMIFTKDVRAALILAEMGEAEYAIVYKTDAISSNKVKVLSTVNSDLHSKINLSIGLIEPKNKSAKSFYKFIFSSQASSVFTHFGYQIE